MAIWDPPGPDTARHNIIVVVMFLAALYGFIFALGVAAWLGAIGTVIAAIAAMFIASAIKTRRER